MDRALKSETKYLVWQPRRLYGSDFLVTKNLPFIYQHLVSCRPPATSLRGSVTVSEVRPPSPWAAPSLGLGMVCGSGLRHFCPLLDSSVRHSALELSIQLTGVWKDRHHGLPSFASFRGVRSVFYLKALCTLSCFLPLFHSQALIPTEPLALLILPQHVLPRLPERTQVGSRSGLKKQAIR